MSSFKVVHILLGKANPNRQNGVGVIVHDLATCQAEHLDVEVWGITRRAETDPITRAYQLSLFKKTRSRFLIDQRLASNLASLQETDLVHLHGVLIPEYFSIARILTRNNVSWVVTPHGAYNEQSVRNHRLLKSLYLKVIDRFVLSNAKGVHVHSQREISFVSKKFALKNIVELPNGLNLQLANTPKHLTAHSGSPTHDEESLVFGFCGRLAIEHKGLDILLEGFQSYIKNGGTGELWLIGGGEDLPQLKEHINKLCLGQTVKLFGAKYGDEKLKLISSMDVFVHTSRWEGMPMAVIEASGLSRPILISRETNMGQYVEKWNSGKVLETNDAEHIQAALKYFEHLAVTEGLDQLSEQSGKMAAEEFNWQKISSTLETELYKLPPRPA